MNTLAKAVIGIGIVAVAVNFYKNKAQKAMSQFQDIAIIPVGLKNFDAKWNNGKPVVKFNIDLNFINPTPTAFNIDGIIMTLKKIVFYDQNDKYIGETVLDMTYLNIPAKSSTTVKNIPIAMDVQTTLINAIALINGGFKLDKIKTEAVINILGIEYKSKN
jgi:hypothetical protein